MKKPGLRPRVFIGSSSEALYVARAVKRGLNSTCHCTIWDQAPGVLGLGILENLVTHLEHFDYAIFVYAPDDLALIRDEVRLIARDNVILEQGMFLAKLGRERVYFLVPTSKDPIKIPSDLAGVLYKHYIPANGRRKTSVNVSGFCREVANTITKQERDWVTYAGDCEVWEESSIKHVLPKEGKPRILYTSVDRFGYGPAPTQVRVHSRTNEVRIRFDLRSRVQVLKTGRTTYATFGGPATGFGRQHKSWVYAIYNWVDSTRNETIMGVCVIHVSPRGFIAYWLSEDFLSEHQTAMILGGAVAPLRRSTGMQ